MSITDAQIHTAADALVAQGIANPTNAQVREGLENRGSMTTIAASMKRWRLMRDTLLLPQDKALETELGDPLLIAVHALRKALGDEARMVLAVGEAEIQGKLLSAERRVEEADARADEANRSAQALQEQLKQALRQVDNANDALREETRGRAQAQAEGDQARAQLTPLQDEVARCNAALAESQAALRERTAAHDGVTAQLVLAERSLAQQIHAAERLQADLARQQASLTEKTSELERTQHSLAEQRAESQRLRATVLSLEGQAQLDEIVRGQFVKERDAAKSDLAQVRHELGAERARREVEQLRHREEIAAAREEVRNERSIADEQLRTFTQRFEALNAALARSPKDPKKSDDEASTS